jgi:hypothetical protein
MILPGIGRVIYDSTVYLKAWFVQRRANTPHGEVTNIEDDFMAGSHDDIPNVEAVANQWDDEVLLLSFDPTIASDQVRISDLKQCGPQ